METKRSKQLKDKVDIKPMVAIVIVNWNSVDDVTECIRSLRKTDYPCYEIIIVDNASTDGSPERIAEVFPDITLLRNKENLGYGTAANTGMKYAVENGCQYIFLFSPDAVMNPDVLGRLVEAAEKKPQVGLLAPVLYFYHTPTKLQYCGSIVDWDQFTQRILYNLNDWKTVNRYNFWLWATAVLIRRDVIRKIGYFNEEYFAYCEDLEYSLKASRAGFGVELLPSVSVYHKSNSTDIGGRANVPLHQYFYMTRNEYWFWKKYVSGFKRITLLRIYLAQITHEIGRCKANAQYDVIEAYLDGLYCAFRRISGKWDKKIKMPKIIKTLIVATPFFWTDLFRGHFSNICSGVLNRMKRLSQQKVL